MLKVSKTAIMNYFVELLNAPHADNDDGYKGDCFEKAIRYAITGTKPTYVRGQGKPDIMTTKIIGTKATVEIKTANGELDDSFDKDLIIYCPWVDENVNPLEQAFVFDNATWLEMLDDDNYPSRGKVKRLSRGKWHIQEFYVSSEIHPKQSKKLADYIWDYCYEQSILGDLLTK